MEDPRPRLPLPCGIDRSNATSAARLCESTTRYCSSHWKTNIKNQEGRYGSGTEAVRQMLFSWRPIVISWINTVSQT